MTKLEEKLFEDYIVQCAKYEVRHLDRGEWLRQTTGQDEEYMAYCEKEFAEGRQACDHCDWVDAKPAYDSFVNICKEHGVEVMPFHEWAKYDYDQDEEYFRYLNKGFVAISFREWLNTYEVDHAQQDRYKNYLAICDTDDTWPLAFEEWQRMDEFYKEHVAQTPNPLTPSAYQRIVWKADNSQEKAAAMTAEIHKVKQSEAATQADNLRLQDEVLSLREQLAHEKAVTAASLRLAQSTPSNQPLFPHYFKEVSPETRYIDVYWVLKAWEVADPAIAHALKKLLAAGRRGAKDTEKDLKEARDSITRALELL